MLRKVFLFTLVLALVMPAGSDAGQAPPGPATNDKAPFVPGQALVRFKSDASLKTAASLVAPHDAMSMYRIAGRTFTLAVPEGQEIELVKTLASDPAVQYASLNYWIAEPSIAPPASMLQESLPQVEATPSQEQPTCITDLWMSATPEGGPLLDNMLPSNTSEVYVVFEYADCDHESVGIEVFYPINTPPLEIFDKKDLILISPGASGETRVRVPAEDYFTNTGTFPVGRYVTILSVSPEGGWDPVREAWWHVSTFPNDDWFLKTSNRQWSLHSTGQGVFQALPEADINAPQAWDITTGSSEIIIANISSGVWLDHPDLKNKIWVNRNEIPGNGIDDDGNGCADDVYGCEFWAGEAIPDPNDLDVGWGTLTSGIAAADTNNKIGIAGLSWGARILPIKVVRKQPDGTVRGPLSNLIQAIDYALDSGARIIHIGPRVVNPGQVPESLELLRAVIEDAVSRGALVVAGTGGNLVNPDPGAESVVTYPAGFENVVAVGATDPHNERARGSNYWAGIDLVAPGKFVFSTYFEPLLYISASETNLAAAHVEGVAALIWSVNPHLSPDEIRAILQQSAVDLGALGYDEEYGYGKLDAAEALLLTPHRLWLSTPNADNRLALTFLLDDWAARTCQNVWNSGTGPLTWSVRSSSEWPAIVGPGDSRPAPVPSDIQVCAGAGSLSGYGTFKTTLEARSTLTRHEGPVGIDVTAVYQPRLSRIRLSFIRR